MAKAGLIESQARFAQCVGKLLVWCAENGRVVTLGEAWRTPEQQKIYLNSGKTKVKTSQHQLRLAIDLNLLIEGKLATKSKDYGVLGAYWKSLDPHLKWGGDWGWDGNHFEYAT